MIVTEAKKIICGLGMSALIFIPCIDVVQAAPASCCIKYGNNSYGAHEHAREHNYIGLKHFLNENYDKAIDEYNDSIRIYAGDYETYLYRGNVYNVLKKSNEAIADYTTAIGLKPTNERAYARRGDIYLFNLNNYEKALEDYTTYISIKSKDDKVYEKRALTNIHLGRKQAALEDINRALKLNPKNESAMKIKSYLLKNS